MVGFVFMPFILSNKANNKEAEIIVKQILKAAEEMLLIKDSP